MLVNQIAVFMENKRGELKRVTDALKAGKVNILTASIADTKDFGILRIITDDNENAKKVLRSNGFLISSDDLIGIEVAHEPGALADALAVLDNNGIDIEYLYSYEKTDGSAYILFRVHDTEKTISILNKCGVKLIDKSLF